MWVELMVKQTNHATSPMTILAHLCGRVKAHKLVGSLLVSKHCENKQPTTGRISETQNFLATTAFPLSVRQRTSATFT